MNMEVVEVLDHPNPHVNASGTLKVCCLVNRYDETNNAGREPVLVLSWLATWPSLKRTSQLKRWTCASKCWGQVKTLLFHSNLIYAQRGRP